jgi:hypothetical protein
VLSQGPSPLTLTFSFEKTACALDGARLSFNVRQKVMDTDGTPRSWPIRLMVVIFLVVGLLWSIADPVVRSSHSDFFEMVGLGVFGIYIVRTSIAAVRKETGRGWMFYAALIVVVPVAAALYAGAFIPLSYPPLH